uniref:Zinc finger and BTB domain containing 12, tandem duplicate 1 n=1 Tax=Esox lucius TaxID=8010 RepID=A0A3P8XLY1_ESOLU
MEVLCFRLPGHGDATLKSMNSLRSKQQFCDITIVASGRQTFRGHKVVLAACSPFLRDQFLLNPSSELQVSVLHSSSVVCELLQSCYTGVLQFSPKEIVNYLTAASYLQMEHVVEKCRGALGKYMQPRNPTSSKQPPSPGQSQDDDQTDSNTQTDIRHDDDTLDEIKVKVTEEDEGREDYDVFRICIEDEQEPAERQEGEEGAEEATEGLQGGRYTGTDSVIGVEGEGDDVTPAEMAQRVGGFEREGLRAWRRRLTDSPKVGRGRGRGRGFKRKRASYRERERRPLGMQYQEAWRLPTGAELMQGFGLDFGQEAMRSGFLSEGELPRLDYGMGMAEGQGDDLGPRDGNSLPHYSLDDPSGDGGEGSMGMGTVPAGVDEAGDESVAVVGSTSSTSGPVACEHCGLSFPSAQSLAVHSRATHLLYVCPCCGQHFNHSSNLNRHMAVHRGAKVHSCPLCHKTFTQKSTLCDHMNLHSGERPHCCAYCHSRFAHKPALRRHLKEQHGKTTGQNSLEAQAKMERAVPGGGEEGPTGQI